jgi:hypothetical protein
MLPNEEDDELRALLRESYGASEPPESFVEQLQERLLSEWTDAPPPPVEQRPAVDRTREASKRWNWIPDRVKGLSMRQRIAALGSIGIAVLVGCLVLWGAVDTRPASAMEQMAEKIRQAKSFRCTGTLKSTSVTRSDQIAKPLENTREEQSTVNWLAPDSVRADVTDSTGQQAERTIIVPGGNRPWISIDHPSKTYSIHPPEEGDWQRLFLLHKLGEYSGQADRDLGTKEIDGKKARGFVIGLQKIAPQEAPATSVEIWLDVDTNLPMLLRSENKRTHTMMSSTTEFTAISESTGIEWNIELDPKLFDPTPPEGYKDVTLKAPTSGDPLQAITEALRVLSSPPVGRYPSMKEHPSTQDVEMMVRGADPEATARMLREYEVQTDSGPKKMKISAEVIAERVEVTTKSRDGFLHLWALVKAGRDVAYYGNTVAPTDKDKVLLRWKLDDGRYQVIFGDLHAEVVTAERLHGLEGGK